MVLIIKILIMIYTKEDYLNKNCTHRKYYAQFVTEDTKDRVKRNIGVDTLKEAYEEDEHFNSIPLVNWDIISTKPRLKIPMETCNDYLTPAGAVCIFKEAARQLIE